MTMAFNIERVFEEATKLARELNKDSRRKVRRRKQQQRRVKKVLRALALMAFVTFIVVPAMIAGGFLFGPHGVEGLITAPLVLMSSYALILYFTFRRQAPPSPKLLGAGPIAMLPAQTTAWLDEERAGLPWAAQRKLDNLNERIEALAPQVDKLNPETPSAAEVRRLLGEELPELVRSYRKVPPALTQQPLYGGASPEKQLLEGLDTIDKQIVRVSEQLAKDDLHALATHQRYLELKYKRGESEDDS